MVNHTSNSGKGARDDVKADPREIFADGKRVERAVREAMREDAHFA